MLVPCPVSRTFNTIATKLRRDRKKEFLRLKPPLRFERLTKCQKSKTLAAESAENEAKCHVGTKGRFRVCHKSVSQDMKTTTYLP